MCTGAPRTQGQGVADHCLCKRDVTGQHARHKGHCVPLLPRPLWRLAIILRAPRCLIAGLHPSSSTRGSCLRTRLNKASAGIAFAIHVAGPEGSRRGSRGAQRALSPRQLSPESPNRPWTPPQRPRDSLTLPAMWSPHDGGGIPCVNTPSRPTIPDMNFTLADSRIRALS